MRQAAALVLTRRGTPIVTTYLRPGHLRARLAAMTSSTDSNPEDEYADDEYADYDAEDRDQPSEPTEIPADEPEDDVLEQRQEVPYGDDDR
jgi:hypothetical protein